MMRFATADYSFPLLTWEKPLRVASDLEMDGIDLSFFQDRSQLKGEEAVSETILLRGVLEAAAKAAA